MRLPTELLQESQANINKRAIQRRILDDLYAIAEQDKQKPISKSKSRLFCVLSIAGVITFSALGFDGGSTMLSLFLPYGPLFLVLAGVFALISIAFFFAFERKSIAENQGIPLYQDTFLYIFTQQLEVLRTLKNKNQIDETSFNAHKEAILKALNKKKCHPYLVKALKILTNLIGAVIAFSEGFFAGEAAVAKISSSFFTSVPMIACILVSVLIGLLAVFIYTHLERPAINLLIDQKLTPDTEHIKHCSFFSSGTTQSQEVQTDPFDPVLANGFNVM